MSKRQRKGINPKSLENLKNGVPFEPGNVANPHGRPRKYVSALAAEIGYKQSEVIDCITSLMAMTRSELIEVSLNDEATILELTVAKALLKGGDGASLWNIETALSRAIGKPKETTESKVDINIKAFQVVIKNPEAAIPVSFSEAEVLAKIETENPEVKKLAQ